MEYLDKINAVWGAIIPIVGLIAWSLRQENRINGLEKALFETDKRFDKGVDAILQRFGDVETKHEALQNNLARELSDVQKALSRIEGRLGIGMHGSV